MPSAADLVPTPNLVTAEAARTPIAAADVAAPFMRYANALDKAGEAIEGAAVAYATEAGKKAVTLDADGNVQVDKIPLAIGPVSTAFNRSAELGFFAKTDQKSKEDLLALRLKHQGDPEAFRFASDNYVDTLAANAPNAAMADSVRTAAHRHAFEIFQGLATQRQNVDLANNKQSIVARQASIGNELVGLSLGGDTESENFKSRWADWQAGQRELVSNPLYGYSQAQADYDGTQFLAKLQDGVRYNRVSTIYSDKTLDEKGAPLGGAGPALEFAKGVLTDPKINLTESERFAAYNRMTSQINAAEAMRRRDLGEATKVANDYMGAVNQSGQFTPEVEGNIRAALKASGGDREAMRFDAFLARKRQTAAFSQLPLAQMPAVIDFVARSGGAGLTGEVKGAIDDAAAKSGVSSTYLYRLARRESSFDPNAQASTSSAGGLFQFTDGTWKDTLAKHGAEYGVPLTASKSDARANAAMAAAFTKDNADALKAAGVPVNDGWLGVAHFAGASGATQLFKADPSAQAAAVLPAAAASNRSLFYDKGGRAYSVAETLTRLTNGFGTPGERLWAGPSTDPRLMGDMASLAGKKAREGWSTISADMDKGVAPTEGAINQLADVARIANDHELLETMAARLDRFQGVRAAGVTPLDTQSAAIGDLERQGAAGKVAPAAAAWLTDLRSQYTALRDGLEQNPVRTTVAKLPDRFEAVKPLDFSSPDSMVAGLRDRAKIAQFGSQNWRVTARSALDQADVQTFKAAYASTDVTGKTKLLGNLVTGLGEAPEVLHATLAKIADTGQPTLAIAGLLHAQNADAARMVVAGQAALSADKRFAAPDGGIAGFDAGFAEKIPPADFGGKASDAGAWRAIKDAVRAHYAASAVQENDLSGALNSSRLAKSVKEVTGGTVTWRSNVNLPPAYGMSQGAFEAKVRGLTDADFGEARTGGGEKITADLVRRRGDFKSLGDGKYLVQFGPASAATYAARADGSPFILTLR